MHTRSLPHTFHRYKTLLTGRISVLPIAILMPHSACNCRCVMCDIWKANKNSKQLTVEDFTALLETFKRLDTKRVVMSGGEALLNRNFFTFCEILKEKDIKITLLSTGLTIHQHADKILQYVDDVIVSLDGDEAIHDEVRNIRGAFELLKKGVKALKQLKSDYPISARCVIHQYNYKIWDNIIISAKEIGLDSISFLPADVSSQAFNREAVWTQEKQDGIVIREDELPLLDGMIQKIILDFQQLFDSKFIVESPEKIKKILQHYEAHYGLNIFPIKRCNAPWVSAVVEADGTVRPCFFHDVVGSIKEDSLKDILNNKQSIHFRRNIDMDKDPTCIKCVCYLNLNPTSSSY